MIKLRDLRTDSWFAIVHCLKKGKIPHRNYVIAALNRGESSIPVEAQAFLADVLEGRHTKQLRRGRSPLSQTNKYLAAFYIVNRFDRLKKVYKTRYRYRNFAKRAVEKLAEEQGRSPETVRTALKEATKIVRSGSDISWMSEDWEVGATNSWK